MVCLMCDVCFAFVGVLADAVSTQLMMPHTHTV